MQHNKMLPKNTLEQIRVFLVDDEDLLAWSIETELKALGAEVMRAACLREALERFPRFAPDVAITDISLPDGNGLELLKKWRLENPELPTILITAHGAIDSAITALRLGAMDYLQKPFDMKALVAAVKRAAEIAQLRQKVHRLQGSIKVQEQLEIVGSSPQVVQMKQQLEKIARSKADTALILGESGTGKELAARMIHYASDRAEQPFVEINCASIPETLLESELFGHERGAFTDARERKLGLFEMAKDGTVFLDEIGELPIKLQTKLLRALEYRRFKRLGGTKDIECSARIVAATNRDLLAECRAGRFREDFYYRLNVLPIRIPPLRERKDDIGDLTEFFLKKHAERLGLKKPVLHADALAALLQHDWPGNIRELSNMIQRAMVFYEPTDLHAEHLEFDELMRDWASLHNTPTTVETGIIPITVTPVMPSTPPVVTRKGAAAANSSEFILPDNGINLDELEKTCLIQALDRAKNNQTRAAQLLGVSRHKLRYRLEKHGLQAP